MERRPFCQPETSRPNPTERSSCSSEPTLTAGRSSATCSTNPHRTPVPPTLCDVRGIGPIGAAIILGSVGDITRFRTAGHFASYNATAPSEASSGGQQEASAQPEREPHTQPCPPYRRRHPAPLPSEGREYYQKKLGEGKTTEEAIRALKRRVSDVVYRRLLADSRRTSTYPTCGSGRTPRDDSDSSVAGSNPDTPALRISHFPDPTPRLRRILLHSSADSTRPTTAPTIT